MQLLLTIITEFSNTEKEISEERKGQIHKLFAQYFPDIAYNCVIVLMQQHPGEEAYVNQTQKTVKKVGYTRFRAIELLKILFVTVQKMGVLGKEIVSSLLRAKVIDSMLHMIRTYTFCSLSHAQCIQILNAMKENFEQEDVQKLKEFVFVELEGQAKFEFPSGRTCSGPNMGQITQIAFELRNLTQQELNEESSDEDATDKDAETQHKMRVKRREMKKWLKFCKSKIEKIEKVWNRKLEDAREESDSASEPSAHDTLSDEPSDDPFGFAPRGFMSRSMIIQKDDPISKELQEVVDSMMPASKDDTHVAQTHVKEFNQHEYWHMPSEHSIEDLMRDLD